MLRRELISGVILGAILGSIGFARIALWSAFSSIYGEHWFLVAVAVGLSLVAIVLWGSLIGAMLPFGLKRMGVDPATSSAPFVATICRRHGTDHLFLGFDAGASNDLAEGLISQFCSRRSTSRCRYEKMPSLLIRRSTKTVARER